MTKFKILYVYKNILKFNIQLSCPSSASTAMQTHLNTKMLTGLVGILHSS